MQTEIKYWKTTSLGEMQNIDRYLITLQQQYQNWLNHFNVYQQRDQEREEEEKKSIYEDLFHNKGERALITLTRFDNLEFDEIYKACKLVLRIPGQGRNHSLFPKDMLLVTLTYLASGSKFSLTAQMFNIDESLVYRTIHFTVRQIARPLVAKFCVMQIQLKRDEPHFSNFPNAVGAIDTTFILINKPGSHDDQKKNWSFKHGQCGVKIQALVRPNGLCALFQVGIQGSVHDLTALKESLWLDWCLTIRVTVQNGVRVDRHLPVLFDKGYTGLNSQGYPEAIVTIKKPTGRDLTQQELAINSKIESDRVIVENYFGRLKSNFGVLAQQYRGDRFKLLQEIMETCIALNNFYNSKHPLRMEHQQDQG